MIGPLENGFPGPAAVVLDGPGTNRPTNKHDGSQYVLAKIMILNPNAAVVLVRGWVFVVGRYSSPHSHQRRNVSSSQ